MDRTKDFFKIEIDGRQFKTSYLVYVVKLSSKSKGDFYYVGQTGDRHYLSARPAFRRLAGHFSDQGHSTENQIYRQIAVKILGLGSALKKQPFTKEIKEIVSDFLSESKTEMFAHPIANFSSNTDIDSHNVNRQLSEKIENEIMDYLIRKEGIGKERLLNKKIPKTEIAEYSPLTKQIINYMNI